MWQPPRPERINPPVIKAELSRLTMRLAMFSRTLLLLAMPAVLVTCAAAQDHPNVQPSNIRDQLNAPPAASPPAPAAAKPSAPQQQPKAPAAGQQAKTPTKRSPPH